MALGSKLFPSSRFFGSSCEWLYNRPLPIEDNGVLLNLKFAAVGSAGSVSPLVFEWILFNEDAVLVKDGHVELSAAAPDQAELTGRVINSMGQAIPNARVTLTDTTEAALSVMSNVFGAYRFGELSFGQTFTLSVEFKALIFTPLTVSVVEQSANIDMIGN